MPHVGGGGGDDLASSDELKVFEHEGDEEKEKKSSSENLTDIKSSLVTDVEEKKDGNIPGHSSRDYGSPKSSNICRPDSGPLPSKSFEPLPPPAGPIGYVVSYPHHNGSLGHMPMGNKVPMPPHPGSPLPFMVYNGEHFTQPPPAHMGIPPVSVDPKTDVEYAIAEDLLRQARLRTTAFKFSIPRPPVYHLGPPGQYPPVFNPDFTHQLQWHGPALYPTTSAGFRNAYTAALPVTSASLPRFAPQALLSPYPGISAHPGISHPALITTGPKQEIPFHHMQNNHSFFRHLSAEYHTEQKYNPKCHTTPTAAQQQKIDKKSHIKKPLNAFMLYMKEMRAKVVAECTLKESAAINQILGRRWHSLSREEQAKYYEMARKERQLHMQLYPGWSARDNYAQQTKKKKRKKDRSQDGDGNSLKKCRARFGLNQTDSWCKPCRRKKKCIRYQDGNENAAESEDNMGSTGSVEAPTPDSKSEEDSDAIGPNPSPEFSLGLSSPQEDQEDRKPVLDSNGIIVEERPKVHHHHHPLYHPLSVHHLIQPHFSSRSINREPCDIRLPTPPSPPP